MSRPPHDEGERVIAPGCSQSRARAPTVQGAGIALALCLAAGCGSRQPDPVAALHEYSASLRARDYSAAYDKMSESFQAKHSREDFIRMMKESEQEAAQTAQMLSTQRKEVEITADIHFGFGDSLRLVQEGR